MPVDHFTVAEFENALPVRRVGSISPMIPAPVQIIRLWKPLGIVQGEYAYLIPIRKSGLGIHIRSSIGRSGSSADCGEDSIRAWLVNIETGQYWGSKISKYTTRVPGWERRMKEVFQKLWDMGEKVHPCPKCQHEGVLPPMKVFITRAGQNKGGLFLKCGTCGHYEWLGKDE